MRDNRYRNSSSSINLREKEFVIHSEQEIRRITMNRKNLLNLLHQDRQLMKLFTGMVVSVAVLISLAVTAGVWYL